ncbi:MAG: alpha/beta fold hydrolase [bacterium]|nr:alpha/beta fold hydrolase [bacterium]
MLKIQPEHGPPLIVKDYSQRSFWVRHLLAPLFIRHELAMLERLKGVRGLPEPRGRVDRLAFAIEWLEGRPLQRRSHYATLPSHFFDALQEILDELADRGVLYVDLRSPSNVIAMDDGSPALVDVASAFPIPVPKALRRLIERRALRKLRSRFEAREGRLAVVEDHADDSDLDLGGVRLRYLDWGRLDDPVPAVFLHDIGLSSRVFAPILSRAKDNGRRGIAPDLPGFGRSRGKLKTLSPGEAAQWFETWVDAMRIGRIDLIGHGWGGFAARALAQRMGDRVRFMITIDSALLRIPKALAELIECADSDDVRAKLRSRVPSSYPGELRADIETAVEKCDGQALAQLLRAIPKSERAALDLPWPDVAWLVVDSGLQPGAEDEELPRPLECVTWNDPLTDADRLWSELARRIH